MKTLFAFLSGVLFSIGLTISGMTDPKNIIGFLDITGDWNPALMLVLFSAVIVAGVGYRIVWKRSTPLFDVSFHVPGNRLIDKRLIIGSVIFGIGWGLVGLCPGPVLSNVAFGNSAIYIFIAAMIGGMLLQRLKIFSIA